MSTDRGCEKVMVSGRMNWKRVCCCVLSCVTVLSAAGAVGRCGSAVSLNGEWRLCYFPQPDGGAVRNVSNVPVNAKAVAATVPGNCELDLERAGLLPKMELGTNCWTRSFEGSQYLYTKTFTPCETPPGGKAELVFDGIDTLADVFLNGEKVGEADNMMIAHRFDVTGKVAAGAVVAR